MTKQQASALRQSEMFCCYTLDKANERARQLRRIGFKQVFVFERCHQPGNFYVSF